MADSTVVLKALSSEPRLRILKLLKKQSLCVNALASRTGLAQSAVSQHLRILSNARLVNFEKRGYWMHYSVNENALSKHKDFIIELLTVDKTTKNKNTERRHHKCLKRK